MQLNYYANEKLGCFYVNHLVQYTKVEAKMRNHQKKKNKIESKP